MPYIIYIILKCIPFLLYISYGFFSSLVTGKVKECEGLRGWQIKFPMEGVGVILCLQCADLSNVSGFIFQSLSISISQLSV